MFLLGLCALKRKTKMVNCHSHPILSRVHTILNSYCWCWPWSPGKGSVRQGSPLYSLFSLFLEENGYVHPHLRSKEMDSNFSTVDYLHELFGDFLQGRSASSLFVDSVMYLLHQYGWIHTFLLYSSSHNPILLYFVTQTVSAFLVGALLIGSCVPLKYPITVLTNKN